MGEATFDPGQTMAVLGQHLQHLIDPAVQAPHQDKGMVLGVIAHRLIVRPPQGAGEKSQSYSGQSTTRSLISST